MKLIDGKKIAKKIKDEIVAEIVNINKNDKCIDKRPGLAIILVGEKEDSKIYASLKEEEAKKVGIDTHLYKFEKNVSEKELKNTIEFLNNDKEVDAILLQLPLPSSLNTDEIIKSINPKKDVDCFHPDNLEVLLNTCSHDIIIPPLFQVVFKIMESINYELEGKKVCIVANSKVFKKNLAKALECRKAEVETADPDDGDFRKKTSRADALITAVGKPNFIKAEDIKKDSLVIDIGINKEKKRIIGDVCFKDVKDKVGFITSVPGGVGPITVAMALYNTVLLYKKNNL